LGWIIAVGARHIEDDLWGVVAAVFAVDGGESAEMKAADIGHDPGMARRNALLSEEHEESG
jgi:hypothetical protein